MDGAARAWRVKVKHWLEKLLWIRVGIEVSGMTYTISVHRFGLQKTRVIVCCKLPGRVLAAAPISEKWRLN